MWHEVLRLLGVQRELGTEFELMDLLGQGLAPEALLSLQQHFGLTWSELAMALQTTERSLQRYRQSQQQLPGPMSERLFYIARLCLLAEQTFGQCALALAWLRTPNIALAARAPLSLLDRQMGIERVHNALRMIDAGGVA